MIEIDSARQRETFAVDGADRLVGSWFRNVANAVLRTGDADSKEKNANVIKRVNSLES